MLRSSKRCQCPQSPRKSSKTTQSPQILRSTFPRKVLKRSSKSPQKILKMSSKGPQSPHDLRCSNDPEKVLKFLNVFKGSTKSSYPQNVIKVLKTSPKCSQIPQILSRSSDPRNVVNVPKNPRKSSKTTQSPQISRSTVPRKVLKRSSKSPQTLLKMSSKGPQSPQEVLKVFKMSPK